ncbi:hypothetical protein IW262DRAFT_122072 [Armillaria fumosa]|nr:hypothetical protein IW262DRAFT_122072 [Armillaria fumosa]
MASPSRAGDTISTPTNSRGLIGGIIGGVIAFSALLTLLVFQFVRKRRRLRITSSLFNFDTEKFVGAKRSAEFVGEACVSISETHLVSPTVVKWEPASGWGDDRCHDDGDEVFRPTRASRDEGVNTSKDAAHIPFTTMLESLGMLAAIPGPALLLCLTRRARCRKPLGCQFEGSEVRCCRLIMIRLR